MIVLAAATLVAYCWMDTTVVVHTESVYIFFVMDSNNESHHDVDF